MSPPGRHIVFVGGTSEPGGLHVHTADVAAACAAAGTRASILCTSIDHFSSLIEGRDVGLVVAPGAGGHLAVAAALRRMRATDAVLCRGHFGETGTIGLLAVRAVCESVYTIDHRPMERRIPRWPMRRAQGLATALLVKRLIAVSEEIRCQACDDFGIAADHVAVCRNWYDPDFRPASASRKRAARKALGLPPHGTVIGYHGRLAPEKRVDILIEAYARLDGDVRAGAPLVLIGGGWKEKELRDLVTAHGISDTVVFAGWQPDMARTLAAIDIYVLPSLVEGFPLALMEAMACGAYCLAHPMSSTVDLLGEAGERGVLWPFDTAGSMAGALDAALGVPAGERSRTGVRAAAWIRANHARESRLPPVLRALDVAGDGPLDALPGGRRLEFSRQ